MSLTLSFPCQQVRQETSKKPDDNKDQKQAKLVSNGVKESGLELSEPVGPGFTPVYLSNSSQPCQCSACVGAMAASITKVRRRGTCVCTRV